MAREIQKHVIGEHRYEMTLLPATKSYKLFHRLFKMFGPSFGQIMDVVSESGSLEELDLSSAVVGRGIQTITENVREEDLDHVIEVLKGTTHVAINNGDKSVPLSQVFEAHFQGDIGGMFRWLYWGLGVQYRNFFDAFSNIAGPNGADQQQELRVANP